MLLFNTDGCNDGNVIDALYYAAALMFNKAIVKMTNVSNFEHS